MLKLKVKKARAHVTMRNKTEGSVLQGTVKSTCLGVDTRLEIESDEPGEKIAELVRYAENGCFTLQALIGNPPVTTTVIVNGQPLAAEWERKPLNANPEESLATRGRLAS